MKKKILATVMAIVCTLSLAACGGDGDKDPGSNNSTPSGNEGEGAQSSSERGTMPREQQAHCRRLWRTPISSSCGI